MHVKFLAPRILRCLLDFWKICEPQILASVVILDSCNVMNSELPALSSERLKDSYDCVTFFVSSSP
jgi:hypothetical protein